MNLWVTLLMVFFLAAIATIIKYFGGENLIAGYNTSSPTEKRYMAENSIGAFVGNYIYLLALIILGGYLLRRAGFVWGQEVAWGMFIAVIIVMLVQVQRFAPPPELTQNKTGKVQKTILIIAAVFTLAILGNVAWISLPPHFILTSNSMKITGAYGSAVAYSKIDSIRLETDMPSVGFKSNGVNMGPILKGHFMVDNLGRSCLFLRSARGPVIVITLKDHGEPLLINMSDPDQTRHLYQKLKDRLD